MFNKEGIPFFIIMIPFLSIIFSAFFGTSYYLKLSNENFQTDLSEYTKVYQATPNYSFEDFNIIVENKKELKQQRENKYIKFIWILTGCILTFMFLFTLLMSTIINDLVKKYIQKVQNEEHKLKVLNETLSSKVALGIEDGKRKDKAILEQSKLARMGSMISMIAHQWRQPLSELSGILMELETATQFNKITHEHILNSVHRSNQTIDFMSNTIDDFRNFYKPDKKKEHFQISNACKNALTLVDATLHNLGIKFIFDIQKDRKIYGYPTEFAQVILNLISNAKDILIERTIQTPTIKLCIKTKGLQSIITIEDNAGGIQESNLERIFDPYYTTKDATKGTGLGLYISKLIIEKNMGGELSVENGINGAVFKIVILG